ncbi:SRPBCC domain-containing protein [Mycobacterium sp. M23085]|uniref:SRPBCC domain-containing protein n=1 Tax=Mycobacterium sp. M23085 TaxID=3378087 RepID=UPI0038779A61
MYAALVEPQALLEWLPPHGMSGQFEHFDVRPGGSYRMRLTYADAPESGGKSNADSDVVDVRFVEIVPDERVVQAVEFESDDTSFAGTMTMTWSVTAVSVGSTRVEIRADDVPAGISRADHIDGLRSSLTNLAAYLTGARVDPD